MKPAVRIVLLGSVIANMMACRPVPRRDPAPVTRAQVTLAVLPAESDKFPEAARAVTESLRNADVTGVDRKQVSQVSLEVVQLSIECVEASVECYDQVARSLEANRLLFAEVAPSGRRKVKITVTLFDAESRAPKRAEKVFASEKDATVGVADLVAEATR